MLLIAKIIGLTIAGLILLVILFLACVLIRKSMPYVFASDIETLAASGPYNSERMASEVCGYDVHLVGSAEVESPLQGLPKGRIKGWRPLYPIEGSATVRITGVGFDRRKDKVTGPCEATMSFKYRFRWSDNGRAVVLESEFLDRPVITRP